jgi:hypothetical protein
VKQPSEQAVTHVDARRHRFGLDHVANAPADCSDFADIAMANEPQK